VDDTDRNLVAILFPVAVILVALTFLFFWHYPSGNSAYVEIAFGDDHANVSELWIFTGDFGELRRDFPSGHPFSGMTIDRVSCQGEPRIGYRDGQSAVCAGEVHGQGVLSVEYTLHDPYRCYEDMCLFEAGFYEGFPATVEFNVVGANDYGTFPDKDYSNILWDQVSSARLVASLPDHYQGEELQGGFLERFMALKERYARETGFESGWITDVLLVISFQSFISFLVFLTLGASQDVEGSHYSPELPSDRTPRELSCVFFRDLPRQRVLEATVIHLASQGKLEFEGRELKVLSREAEEGFESEVLRLLDRLSQKGSLQLDTDWLYARIEELGRGEFREELWELREMPCDWGVVGESRDPTGVRLVMLMQAVTLLLSLSSLVTAPSYLVNYPATLAVLMLTNLFWAGLVWQVGRLPFSRYTHKAAVEKARWLSFRRFLRSEVNLEKESDGLDWNRVLTAATLFGHEDRVLNVAERGGHHFDNIYNPRLAVATFDHIRRAAR